MFSSGLQKGMLANWYLKVLWVSYFEAFVGNFPRNA